MRTGHILQQRLLAIANIIASRGLRSLPERVCVASVPIPSSCFVAQVFVLVVIVAGEMRGSLA